MNVKETLSKEHVVNSLKSLGKLRIRLKHGSLMTYSALIIILFVAFGVRILPIKWEIQEGGNILHLSEFDPYWDYRLASYILNTPNGLISWTSAIDTTRWYPYGISLGGGQPGLAFTAVSLYEIFSLLGANINLMTFCSLIPIMFGMLAILGLYFLGKDFGGKAVGLLAALFLALSPSYIGRTNLGFFDNDALGVFSLILFLIMFLKASEDKRSTLSSLKYMIAAGLILGYFCVGWGAALYPIDELILFTVVLILLKRYTQRLLLSYSVIFGLGLFIAINLPRFSPSYLTTTTILPSLIVFLLLCICEISPVLSNARSRWTFIIVFLALIIGGFGTFWQLGYARGIAGKLVSIINPFARFSQPLTLSVAEQTMTTWGNVYVEWGIAIVFFIAGFYFLLRDLSNKNLLLLVFSLTTLYFAASMVRLLIIMAPFFGILAALGIIGILKPFVTLLKEPPKILTKKKHALERVGKEFSGIAILLIFLILMTNLAFAPQSGGVPIVYSQVYAPVTITDGSLSIVPSTPVTCWTNALQWLNNIPNSQNTVVCAWWDYGYWLSIVGNVTTLCDNGTGNETQIALVGRVYMSNETQAVTILENQFNGPKGPPKYVLLYLTYWSTGQYGNYGGDEGKWVWMARIANGSTFVQDLYHPQWPKWVYDEWNSGTNTTFGWYTSSGSFQWNALGQTTLFHQLSSDVINYTNGVSYTVPAYFDSNFTLTFFPDLVGATTSSSGSTVYLWATVCLFQVNYAAFNAANNSSQ
jgi:dolichyl-diphosphooligosaccharide--protein glycosyltransferase